MAFTGLSKNLNRKDKIQLLKYVIVGGGSVTVDTCSYFILLNFLSYSYAKGLSFFLGSLFSYIINNYWTFGLKKLSRKNIFYFYVLYISTFIVNVFINKMVVEISSSFILAFSFATIVSTVLNYLGQKYWVFSND
jgi:putative flippase GtrA